MNDKHTTGMDIHNRITADELEKLLAMQLKAIEAEPKRSRGASA